MEGNDNSLSENKENIKPGKTEKSKMDLVLFLVIGILIGIIIGHFMSPYLSELTAPAEDPIYQQYEESSWGEYTLYRNEDLKVEISVEHFSSGNGYNARWVNITGKDYGLYGWWNPSSLHDYILEFSDELSEIQLKWFEYMLRYIVR
ncbi:MAG: hypothetical protein ACXADU_20515 [Promethearchaeota archaeon]|jgi:hypothetical protein